MGDPRLQEYICAFQALASRNNKKIHLTWLTQHTHIHIFNWNERYTEHIYSNYAWCTLRLLFYFIKNVGPLISNPLSTPHGLNEQKDFKNRISFSLLLNCSKNPFYWLRRPWLQWLNNDLIIFSFSCGILPQTISSSWAILKACIKWKDSSICSWKSTLYFCFFFFFQLAQKQTGLHSSSPEMQWPHSTYLLWASFLYKFTYVLAQTSVTWVPRPPCGLKPKRVGFRRSLEAPWRIKPHCTSHFSTQKLPLSSVDLPVKFLWGQEERGKATRRSHNSRAQQIMRWGYIYI